MNDHSFYSKVGYYKLHEKIINFDENQFKKVRVSHRMTYNVYDSYYF